MASARKDVGQSEDSGKVVRELTSSHVQPRGEARTEFGQHWGHRNPGEEEVSTLQVFTGIRGGVTLGLDPPLKS